jgi:hypothetical protein
MRPEAMKKIMGLKANVKTVGNAKVGRHQIEGVVGLYLHVGERNARWLYRYHRADGRPTETGLGSTRDVTLKEAVERGVSDIRPTAKRCAMRSTCTPTSSRTAPARARGRA